MVGVTVASWPSCFAPLGVIDGFLLAALLAVADTPRCLRADALPLLVLVSGVLREDGRADRRGCGVFLDDGWAFKGAAKLKAKLAEACEPLLSH